MAIAYAFDQALVTYDELVQKQSHPDYAAFMEAIGTTRSVPFKFSTGTALTDAMRMEDSEGELNVAKEIGIGKPLAVLLRHIYTGRHGGRDLLVTSAFKGIGAVEAQREAVNLVREDVQKHEDIRLFHATERGTPVIFYQTALTQYDSSVTLGLDLDDFNADWLETLGQGFSALADIPLFAAARPWLVAGSLAFPAIGRLLEAIFEKKHFFRRTAPIHFTFPGSLKAREGFLLLMEDDHFEEVRNDYRLSARGQLVAKVGKESKYAGDYPYVILALDGTDREDELGDFQTVAAASELLRRFRPSRKRPVALHLDPLLDLVSVGNDYVFRTRADRRDRQMRLLPGEADYDEDRKRLEVERNANMANVRREELRRSYDDGSSRA